MAKKISVIGSQITLIISVSLVLLILGVLMSAALVTSEAGDMMRRRIAVIVRMDKEATPKEITDVGELIMKSPYAAQCRYYSADEVLEQELQYTPGIMEMLGENPFAAEFEVRMHPEYANPDSMAYIQQRLEMLGSVAEVYTQADIVDNIHNILNKMSVVLSVLALILVVISTVLIFNTVSIAVSTRRFVINTMRLVGATPKFIRAPFVKAGIVSGLIASVIADAMLCGLVAYANSTGLGEFLDLNWTYTLYICAAVAVIGTLFCGTASYAAAHRVLRLGHDGVYES